MITVDQLPEKAIDAARLAMAIALAADGDGIPECIVAAINAWPLGSVATPDAWVRCRRDGSTIILPLPQEEMRDDKN